jgi:hypothetical protein
MIKKQRFRNTKRHLSWLVRRLRYGMQAAAADTDEVSSPGSRSPSSVLHRSFNGQPRERPSRLRDNGLDRSVNEDISHA